jgi:hypothetical protein
MIRVGMTAAGEVRGERPRVVFLAKGIDISQVLLATVGTGKPAELMIKASVFHHDDDHVLDP